MELARNWGISVTTVGRSRGWSGKFDPQNNKIIYIKKHKVAFYHEMAHAAHFRAKVRLDYNDVLELELIAEMIMQALCMLEGKKNKSVRKSGSFISQYARFKKMKAHQVCAEVMDEVEQVLRIILYPNLKFAILQDGKLLDHDGKSPFLLDSELEAEIFAMVFKLNQYSIKLIDKTTLEPLPESRSSRRGASDDRTGLAE